MCVDSNRWELHIQETRHPGLSDVIKDYSLPFSFLQQRVPKYITSGKLANEFFFVLVLCNFLSHHEKGEGEAETGMILEGVTQS